MNVFESAPHDASSSNTNQVFGRTKSMQYRTVKVLQYRRHCGQHSLSSAMLSTRRPFRFHSSVLSRNAKLLPCDTPFLLRDW